jgi:simple sugar transport system permease protein
MKTASTFSSRSAPSTVLPRWLDHGVLPVLNVLLALCVGGAVVALAGESPWQAMRLLVQGAFGDALAWGYTLYYTTDFIFTGLAVAVALHAGLFNIGAEGQATVGGLALGAVLLKWGGMLPAPLLLPLATLVGLLAGAAWALVPAWLQAWRGSHVVVTTIMFNFLASSLMVWLLVNVLMPPGSLAVETVPFAAAATLPSAQTLLALLHIDMPSTPLNLSFLMALACCLAVWVLLWRTRTGYALRVLGQNPEAARYAGFDPKRLALLAMALSGACSALVALNELAGVHHKLLLNFSGGAGFAGIAVALMGRNHPVGIVLASLLFGALYQGGAELAFEMPTLTRDVVVTVQGLIVLFCGALGLMLRPFVAKIYVWFQSSRLARHPQKLATS